MIKLSQNGYYALHAVIYIGKKKGVIVKIKDIATAEGLSEPMLRKIIASLERGGIIKSIRGRNGGVLLAKESKQISLFDIFSTVGEELGLRDCTKGLFCENKENCSTTDVLFDLQKGFNSLLKMNTLNKFMGK